ncbi:hypothetical protein D7I47_07150 [Protaetiibacter intestinalis]|uniref:Uncharacterized protein n=1 Tax=Protaetiibacter intestinalis TaxID=2419774 RepID=A0A387BHM9_9MICO|nr:hypothetical protein D7I47_07150 [Protaetiibacter intestinalis]
MQDHPLDESTGVHPQHFDADGYVVGQPHHTSVSRDELGSLVPPGTDTAIPVIAAPPSSPVT